MVACACIEMLRTYSNVERIHLLELSIGECSGGSSLDLEMGLVDVSRFLAQDAIMMAHTWLHREMCTIRKCANLSRRISVAIGPGAFHRFVKRLAREYIPRD